MKHLFKTLAAHPVLLLIAILLVSISLGTVLATRTTTPTSQDHSLPTVPSAGHAKPADTDSSQSAGHQTTSGSSNSSNQASGSMPPSQTPEPSTGSTGSATLGCVSCVTDNTCATCISEPVQSVPPTGGCGVCEPSSKTSPRVMCPMYCLQSNDK